jgi:hypothetical protein
MVTVMAGCGLHMTDADAPPHAAALAALARDGMALPTDPAPV